MINYHLLKCLCRQLNFSAAKMGDWGEADSVMEAMGAIETMGGASTAGFTSSFLFFFSLQLQLLQRRSALFLKGHSAFVIAACKLKS